MAAPRALIVTPNPADAELSIGFLAEHGIAAGACARIADLDESVYERAGCIVLVEEAINEDDVRGLRELLARQPAWSDMPLVLVAGEGAGLRALVERAFPDSGNVTLLERPLNPLTLVSAVQVGLRARAHQLQVRSLLESREQALRARDNFLAMLAHELRNPLAPIRNAIYLQKTVQNPGSLIERTQAILERQVRHLSRMVDDLLDVARLERGKIALQRHFLDLNGAVAAAVEACQPTVRERAHEVRLSLVADPLPVCADAVRLEQLFANLILNASKFTPHGGAIEVRTARDVDTAVVSVQDNGVGIPSEMLETVFAPFAQGDTGLARSAGGLGIGLAIARAVAELHGGTLRARSDGRDRGAVFEARLPLSTAAVEAPAAPRQAASRAVRGRKVLVVEDNADIRESLRLVLESLGHDVLLAATGDEGLAMALERKPEVALVDIGLPGIDGYEVAERVRQQAQQWSHRIRMVAVTGYGQPADRERAAKAGFDEHLLKPVDPDVLGELLAR